MCFARLACLAYFSLLSVLLLVPDPLTLLGIPRLPTLPGDRTVHFLLFTLLALLVHASRWPLGWGLLAGLLVAHALVMETLQSLVPGRTVELLDFVENLVGLAAGTGIWWFLQKKGKKTEHSRRREETSGSR